MYQNKGKDECDSHLSKREDLYVEAFRQTNENHFLILTSVLYFMSGAAWYLRKPNEAEQKWETIFLETEKGKKQKGI